MKSFMYLYRRTFRNYIKDIVKKPLVLTGYIILLLILLGTVLILLLMPVDNIEMNNSSFNTLSIIFSSILLFLTYSTIKQGLTNGSTFFRSADVNFLFTSPISPVKILVHGIIKSAGSTLLLSLFIIFQLGTFRSNFNVPAGRFMYIVIAYFLTMFLNQLCTMRIYSFFAKHNNIRDKVLKIFNATIILVVIACGLYVLGFENKLEALSNLMTSNVFYYVPVVGWLKSLAMLSVHEISSIAIISIFLLVGFVIFLLYSFKSISTDFYEDVLSQTLKIEAMRARAKEGKQFDIHYNKDKAKIKKIEKGIKATGVKAIFFRQFLEIRKIGLPYVDMRTFFLIVVAIIFSLIDDMNTEFALYMLIYMNFLFGMNSKWSQELEKHYIYLIPGSSTKKCFYSSLNDVLKSVVDGAIVITILAVINKLSVMLAILYLFTFVTYGACFIYADMLSYKLFGSKHSKNLSFFIKLAINLAVIFPGLVLIITLSVITGLVNLAYLILILYNLLACAICFLFGRKLFDNVEYNY